MTYVRLVASGCLLALTVLLGTPAAHGQDLESLFRHGLELRTQRADDAALTVFTQAWTQSRSGRARAQMALAAQALGRWGEADAWLREALALSADPWVRTHRAQLLGAQRTIAQHTGAITVLCNIRGAEVTTGGRSLGQVPMSTPARVTAGTVVVEVRSPGYYPISRPVVVPPGGEIQETVDLVATRAGDRTAGAPAILPAVLPIPPATPPPAPPLRVRGRIVRRPPLRRPAGPVPQPTCAGTNHLSGERCCPPGSEWDPNQGGCVCQVPTLCGPPVAPAPTRGTVRVVVTPPPGGLPPGMSVTLDGRALQPPNYSTDQVEPGTHVVLVTANGFNPAQQSVTVAVGTVSAVGLELTRARTGPPAGTVRVVVSVPNAQVFLDGERVTGTPLERAGITPGNHALRVTAPGHLPETRDVHVADLEVTTVEIPTMRPEPEPPDVGTTGLELEAEVGYGTFLASSMGNFANATGNNYNWGPTPHVTGTTRPTDPLPFSGSVASNFYVGGRLASALTLGGHFGYGVLSADQATARGNFSALTAGMYLRIYFIPSILQWHFDPWVSLGVDYGRLSGDVVNQGVSASITLGVQINVARNLSLGPAFGMSMWFPFSICGYATAGATDTSPALCTDKIPSSSYRPDIGLYGGLGVRYTL